MTYEFVASTVRGSAGREGMKFFPFVFSLFLFVLFSNLAGLIPGSLWVQGKDDMQTRKMVIEKLKTSKERVVAIGTQQIMTAGINVMTHNVINAAGGQADHHIIQRVGRGLRTADDKEILNYYDFVFHNNEYLLEHSKKRIKILKGEGHEIVVKDRMDF